jgi:hypothetical protein
VADLLVLIAGVQPGQHPVPGVCGEPFVPTQQDPADAVERVVFCGRGVRCSPAARGVGHDVRLGSVGRFLRRSSLDEIPQLWNVLMGRMSLVGPRPERFHFVNQFAQNIPRYTARHRVPAGLTGWAQVHGLRGDTSIEDRAIFDNDYIENWSLWGDIKIMIRTLEQLVRRTGDECHSCSPREPCPTRQASSAPTAECTEPARERGPG